MDIAVAHVVQATLLDTEVISKIAYDPDVKKLISEKITNEVRICLELN